MMMRPSVGPTWGRDHLSASYSFVWFYRDVTCGCRLITHVWHPTGPLSFLIQTKSCRDTTMSPIHTAGIRNSTQPRSQGHPRVSARQNARMPLGMRLTLSPLTLSQRLLHKMANSRRYHSAFTHPLPSPQASWVRPQSIPSNSTRPFCRSSSRVLLATASKATS